MVITVVSVDRSKAQRQKRVGRGQIFSLSGEQGVAIPAGVLVLGKANTDSFKFSLWNLGHLFRAELKYGNFERFLHSTCLIIQATCYTSNIHNQPVHIHHLSAGPRCGNCLESPHTLHEENGRAKWEQNVRIFYEVKYHTW